MQIEGIDAIEFFCFTEDHPGEDHLFGVGQRTVTIPWDEFRKAGRDYFLTREVTWELVKGLG